MTPLSILPTRFGTDVLCQPLRSGVTYQPVARRLCDCTYLSKIIGLDEARARKSLNESQIVLGKEISPNLFIALRIALDFSRILEHGYLYRNDCNEMRFVSGDDADKLLLTLNLSYQQKLHILWYSFRMRFL
ncbi:MAG: hypothetical protein IPK79_03360 [Vampirovibrionales bacterium]|nr:hypothetical protein [Vampirovibrionales bacterium]